MSSRPVACRTAGCTVSHQNAQNASHSRGIWSRTYARLIEQALPDVDIVAVLPDRHGIVSGLDQSAPLRSRTLCEHARKELILHRPYDVRQVGEHAVACPFRHVTAGAEGESEIGRIAGIERGEHFLQHVVLRVDRELDVLAVLPARRLRRFRLDGFVFLRVTPSSQTISEIGRGVRGLDVERRELPRGDSALIPKEIAVGFVW